MRPSTSATASGLVLVLGVLCLRVPISAGEPPEIQFTGESWTIVIRPESLRVTAQPRSGPPILLSAGQPAVGSMRELEQLPDRARWRLSDTGVSVEMRLLGEDLSVEIRSPSPGEFTWPVLGLSPPAVALIWPYWEGRYVPLEDEQWHSFLTDHEWDTLEGLCMPFWGVHYSHSCVTYIATNRYNNLIRFNSADNHLLARFTHTFPASRKEWAYGFIIRLSERTSPVEPARQFRQWLIDKGGFVPMKEKLKTSPKAERLLGAPHVYLWGDALLTRHDIKRPRWRAFCRRLIKQAQAQEPSVGKRIQALMSPEQWKQVEEIATLEWPYKYIQSEVTTALSILLERPDFHEETAWAGTPLPAEAQRLLLVEPRNLSTAQLHRLNALLLWAAYPEDLLPVEDWGDGVSLKMLRLMKEAGFDRLRLCVAGWEGIEKRPEVARAADEMGYLFGTYDSFHSVHDPSLKGTDATWPTAQFDARLYDSGPIIRQDGTRRSGFKGRGYHLSPHAARPYVERRVKANMQKVPYSYYFVDCDAYGQVFDDYSPLHPSTQQEDAAARVDRLAWIRDTFRVVIGSEGGSSYAAPVVDVIEGMLTPVIGWDDPDMRNRDSKYYLGGYYPPDGPTVFVEQVPLKQQYERLHYDPRFRLPLNEIVFHDSFVSTHHWSSGSLKFANVREIVALTEILYQCPPLYHLNLDEFNRHRDWMKKHHEFFSPIHRQAGFAPMTDFAWLTPDRLVQRTIFSNLIELTANYGKNHFRRNERSVPPMGVVARWLSSGEERTFTLSD